MRFKKIMTLTIILTCLLIVSAVSAAQNTANDIVGVEYATDDVVAVSVSDFNNTFKSNENYNPTDADVSLKTSINEDLISESEYNNRIIDGNGTTENKGMHITEHNVTLKNYIFSNCGSNEYGSLYWGGNNGIIINCTFTNYNYGYGSTVTIKGDNCTIINCTFSSNFIGLYGAGGALTWESSSGNIIDSTFIENTCYNEAGAIFGKSGSCNIINCTFLENSASRRGGAIYLNHGTGWHIINSSFYHNHASQNGGAIYVYNKGTLDVNNCEFIENFASTYGGAIETEANIFINNSIFYKNNAKESGIIKANEGDIVNSVFLDNTVGSSGKLIMSSTNLEYNWFGNTFKDYNISLDVGGTLKNLLFLNVTHERLMLVGEQNPIDFVFQVYDGKTISDYDSLDIYPVELNLSATNGTLEKTSIIVGEETSYNALDVGIGTITAKFFDRELTINLTCKKSTKIAVGEPVTIYVDQFMKFIGDGFTAQLIPSEAGSLVYSTDNETILSLNNTGFKGINEGKANIILDFIETDEYVSSNASIPINVIKYDTVITSNDTISLDYGKSKTIEATLNPEPGSFVYVSDDEKIAKVNSNGLISAVNVGTTNITIKFEGNRKYKPSNKTVSVTVNKIASTIAINKTLIFNYGDSDSVSAVVSGVDGVEGYVLNHPEAIVNAVNNKITVSNLDVGNYTLVATSIPDKNHYSVNTTTNIIVNKADSYIFIPFIEFDYGGSTTVSAILEGVTDIINVKVENHSEALIYVSGEEITVSNLKAGTYNLVATTVPDKNHNAVTTNTMMIVNKVASIIEFTNDLIFDYGGSDYTGFNIKYANNISSVTVLECPDATIDVEDKIITVSGLNVGEYTLYACTVPDENHYSVNATAKITVNKVDSTVNVLNDIIFDYGSSNSTKALFSGATKIVAIVKEHPEAQINVVGNQITVSGLDAGNYTLIVTTVPDKNHNAVNTTSKIIVNKVDPVITIPPIAYEYDQSGSTRVLVTTDIEFTANVIDYPEAIMNINNNLITVSGLDVGNYILNITTIPNKNYNAITKTTNITVNKSDSNIAINDIVFNYKSYGEANFKLNGVINVTANVINHTEALVNIVDNVIVVSGLDAGSYVLKVTTAPDKNHNAIEKMIKVTVNKIDSEIALNNIAFDYGGNNTTSFSCESCSLDEENIFVIGHPEAIILLNGSEIFISGLNAGIYTLSVTTTPDINYNPVTKTATITVNKVDSSAVIPNIIFDYNDYGNSTAMLVGADTFNANVVNHTEAIVDVNGTMITISNLNAGNYVLSIITIPDDNHNAIETTANITVNKIDSLISILDIAFDYKSYGYGSVELIGANKFIADVVNHTEAVIDINEDMINISNLNAGNYVLEVTTIPDENHNAIKTTINVIVNKIDSHISLDDIVFNYGSYGYGTVELNGANTFNVSVINHTEALTYINGNMIILSNLDAGNYTLIATTISDNNHNIVNATAKITVNKIDSKVTIPHVIFKYGEIGSSELILDGATGINAFVLNHPDAIINIDNNTIFISNLDIGDYELVVTTIPDNNHDRVISTTNITVEKMTTNIIASGFNTVYNGDKYIIATLKDSNGNPLKYVKVTVTFSNGKTDTQTTNKYGQAQFSTNGLAPVQKYSATITFNGNANYEKSTTMVKVKVYKATPKIIAKAQKFKRSDKKKLYTIRLLTNQNIKMKYTKVYIKVNGKLYSAQTNKKGYATFKLTKLTNKGKYKAKIMYGGNSYYNALAIKVKLTVK